MARKFIARSDIHPRKYGSETAESGVQRGQVVFLSNDFRVDSDGDVVAYSSEFDADTYARSIDYVTFTDLRSADQPPSDQALTKAAKLLGYDIDVERLLRVADRLASVDLT